MGILQASILEWVAMPSSRGSSQQSDRTQVSHIAGWFFSVWATREAAQEYCDFTLTFHFHALEKETPVFLPGESQGRGSLAGCRLRGRTESDTTDATQQQQQPPLCSPGALPDLGLKPRPTALQEDSENRTVAFFRRQLFRRQPCYHPLSGLTRKLNVFISPLHFSKKHLYCWPCSWRHLSCRLHSLLSPG